MSKVFQRKIEDFTCGYCSAEIIGNGYTNHCPRCLWSKHVDIHPGDRAATCNGLMKPIEVIQDGDSYTLSHKCTICQYVKRNKLAQDDDMEAVVALAREIATK